MNSKCAVVLGVGSVLPERDCLIRKAWGNVPVSYFQDEEDLNACSFLDLKINKWEINGEWSCRQFEEPWIRIEVLRGQVLVEHLRAETWSPPMNSAEETLIIFKLDEGGSELDEVLLLRLVSVFFGDGKLYRWCDGFQEIGEGAIAALPTLQALQERMLKCE